MDVPIIVIPAENYLAGYVEFGGFDEAGKARLIPKQYRMVWRREDGDYVVVDPAAEYAKQRQARLHR